MSSPKAWISCVPQVFFFDNNIMFCAAWISRSSEYPHGHSYTRSANVMSFFNRPQLGQYFVVGTFEGRTVTRSFFINLAFINPNTECCTVRPNKPLCQPLRFSSCIYTCSCSKSSWTILFAALCFLLPNLWYAFRNNFLALYRLLEPFFPSGH